MIAWNHEQSEWPEFVQDLASYVHAVDCHCITIMKEITTKNYILYFVVMQLLNKPISPVQCNFVPHAAVAVYTNVQVAENGYFVTQIHRSICQKHHHL